MFPPAPSEAIPESHPPCHLCRHTSPLPTFTLTTLDPLTPEIRVMIWDFIVATPCRSFMVKLLSTSPELYEQIAPQLYRSVVIDERTAEGLFYGLGRNFGGTGREMKEDEAAEDDHEAKRAAFLDLTVPFDIKPGMGEPPRSWTEAEAKVVFRRPTEPPKSASPFLRQPVRKLALLGLVRELNVGDVAGIQRSGEASALYVELLKRPVLLETLQIKVWLNASSEEIESVQGGACLLETCLFRYLTSVVFTRPLMERLYDMATDPSDVSVEGLMGNLGGLATSCPSADFVLDVHLPDQFSHSLYTLGALPEAVFTRLLRPATIRLFNVHPCDVLTLPFDTPRFVLWLAPEAKRECCASNKESVVKQLCWCYGPEGVSLTMGGYYNFEAMSILYTGCSATQQEVESEVVRQLQGNKVAWHKALARRVIGFNDEDHVPDEPDWTKAHGFQEDQVGVAVLVARACASYATFLEQSEKTALKVA
ncbi:hypothetical protein IAT38_006478 [Cryptococcus sp. DSM 104549]